MKRQLILQAIYKVLQEARDPNDPVLLPGRRSDKYEEYKQKISSKQDLIRSLREKMQKLEFDRSTLKNSGKSKDRDGRTLKDYTFEINMLIKNIDSRQEEVKKLTGLVGSQSIKQSTYSKAEAARKNLIDFEAKKDYYISSGMYTKAEFDRQVERFKSDIKKN